MYININFSDFCDYFHAHDRDNQFSYDGKKALFDYLEGIEEDTGEKIELDVVALCCYYTEFDDITDVQGIEDIDDLRDNTQVIECDNGHIIIQNY